MLRISYEVGALYHRPKGRRLTAQRLKRNELKKLSSLLLRKVEQMLRLKWTNWQDYQCLTPNAFQQVDRRVSNFILKCGFSWSPAMSPTQPIILTEVGGKTNIESLIQIGFKLEDAKIPEPSAENGYSYDGYLNNAWEALGIQRSYLPKTATPEVKP